MKTGDVALTLRLNEKLTDEACQFIIEKWTTAPTIKSEKSDCMRCPCCNYEVVISNAHYCPQCGQKIVTHW